MACTHCTNGIVRRMERLEEMPFDHVFSTGRGEELCHATGAEVSFDGGGEFWNEYEDAEGGLHYGR